jgi:hypothetical protein
LTFAFYFYLLVPILYMLLMSFPLLAAALVTARARISALEDEVKALVEAWESANAAKVSAEKAAKSAETRAKREQSMVERLDKISVSVGSKCRITPFGYLLRLSLADMCLLILFVSLWYSRENWREASSAKF